MDLMSISNSIKMKIKQINKRINMFIESVNDHIECNKKKIDRQKRIKELKDEIEIQSIKNRCKSNWRLSKERTNMMWERFKHYEKK